MKRPVTVDLGLDDKLKGANSDSEKLVNQDWFKLVLYLKVAWALWQTISAAALQKVRTPLVLRYS